MKGISSMALRQLLADLLPAYEAAGGAHAEIESVGGVDAAKRVQAGEAFDLVLLASDAIAKLIAAGSVRPGSQVNLARSGVAVAVRAGASLPYIGSEEALRDAVLAARSIGYSTGPSGVALIKLFERWGITERIKERIVVAPSGVPVGSLVASGEVALGFQQLGELMHLPGITVIGPMPPEVQITTIFSGGVCTAAADAGAVQKLLAFMASPAAAEMKRRQGMEPA